MKSFRFSLNNVLTWRKTQLSLQEARLEGLRGELRAHIAAEEQVVRTRTEAQADVARSASVNGSDLANLESLRQWSLRESRRLTELAIQTKRAVDTQDQAVVEARRRVRMLERLRDRRHATWKIEAERELDELAAESAIARWRRSS